MANTNNTVAGTPNGGSIIATGGNWFAQQIDTLTNVLGSGIDSATLIANKIGSFKEAAAATSIARQQGDVAPQETAPTYQTSSIADYYSDPKNVQKSLLIAGAFTFLLIGGVYLKKKF